MRIHFLLLCAAVAAMPVFAGDVKREKLAEELLSLMKFDRNIEQSFAAARQMQMAQLKTMTLASFDEAASRNIREKSIDYLQEHLSWEKLKDEYIAACAATFTEDELKSLIEFYKSPAGRTLVEKTPMMMQKSSEIMSRHMIEIAPKIQEIVKEAAEKQKSALPVSLKAEPPKADGGK